MFPQVTVTTSPLHRGEHEVSRKAIAQGMSECFRCPVCSCAPFLHNLAHETAGAARTRHSLRPRFSREATLMHNSGETTPRDRGRTFSPQVVQGNGLELERLARVFVPDYCCPAVTGSIVLKRLAT